MDLNTEIKILKNDKEILSNKINEIYKYWLLESNKYQELKESNKKLLEDYHNLLDKYNALKTI